MTPSENRVLARIAFQEFSETLIPRWISDLASGPEPDFHAHDRVRHAGYIAWNNGWRLTGTGWQALNAAAPCRESPMKCAKLPETA